MLLPHSSAALTVALHMQMVWEPPASWERYLHTYVAAVRHTFRREAPDPRDTSHDYRPPAPAAKL